MKYTSPSKPVSIRLCYKNTGQPVQQGLDRFRMFRKRCKTPEEAATYADRVETRYLRIFGYRVVEWKVMP